MKLRYSDDINWTLWIIWDSNLVYLAKLFIPSVLSTHTNKYIHILRARSQEQEMSMLSYPKKSYTLSTCLQSSRRN